MRHVVLADVDPKRHQEHAEEAVTLGRLAVARDAEGHGLVTTPGLGAGGPEDPIHDGKLKPKFELASP